MLLKEMKAILRGQVKTFNGKRVFYMNPYDLYDYLSAEDKHKISDWNGICIYPSPQGKANEAFYFNWGYGGNPDYLVKLSINAVKDSSYNW